MRIGLDCRITAYTSGGTAVYARRLSAALAELPEMADEELVVLQHVRERGSARPQSWPLLTPSHHRLEQLLLPLELLPLRLNVLHSVDFIPPFARRCRSVITVHDLAFLRYPEFLTADSRRYFNAQI